MDRFESIGLAAIRAAASVSLLIDLQDKAYHTENPPVNATFSMLIRNVVYSDMLKRRDN
jgi:hypothetical protein